jgi:hypothetical protein
MVCYLSDDDLWFSEHVACMRRLLSSADFAHALPLYIDERGEISFYTGDLSIPGYRESLLSGLAEERRRIQLLEHKVNAIQGSRSWRLLTRLARVKSRVLGSK